MAAKQSTKVELRDHAEVLEELRKLIAERHVVGVQGFSITVRTDKSSLNLKWGDLRIRRFLRGSDRPNTGALAEGAER